MSQPYKKTISSKLISIIRSSSLKEITQTNIPKNKVVIKYSPLS